MSVQVKLRRDIATNIATFTPAQGEAVVDTTNNRLIIGDGSTLGGFAAAKLSETVLNNANANTVARGAYGSTIGVNVIEQEITGLVGASVNASLPIPVGSLVLACASFVVSTITGPISFEVGYSGNLSAFGSSLGLSAGSSNVGLIGPLPVYSPLTITLTPAGGAFSAGAVRLAAMYLTFSAPTS